MKFLCDNCKAKYQIADEKVSGRTVRMKCRKCSHLIEIRASVTETSVALSSPASVPATANPAVGEGTMQVSLDALAAPRPATRTAPVGGARAPAAAAPRPGATAPRAAVTPAPKADTPSGSVGLAGSFSESLKSEPAPAFEESPTHALDMAGGGLTEEWYVGINGVPVGPVRLTEFRAKIQSGAVNGESLVWRDGFEEWLPLRNFPELVEVLKAATQAAESAPGSFGRSNSGARPLSAIASSALRSKSTAGMAAVTSASSLAPSPQASSGAGATARSNVIAFGKGATAEKLDFEQAQPQADPFAAPVAVPVVAPDPFASPLAPAPSPAAAPDPFGAGAPFASAPVAANFAPMSAPISASATVAPPSEQPRRGGIPLAGWFAIAAALGLGVVGGSVLSAKDPPPPTVQIVTVSAVAPAAPVPTDTAVARPDTSVVPSASVAAVGTGPKMAGVVPKAGATPEKTAEPATPQVGAVPAVGGVPAIGGVGGPSPGPGGPNPGGGGGEKLTSEQISSVVNGGRNALKRACWEPALGARAANGPSTAKVSVAMTIGPDGRVQSANASGGDGFPTLASCIGGRVRSWVFPQSGTTTQTTPVFNFVAQ